MLRWITVLDAERHRLMISPQRRHSGLHLRLKFERKPNDCDGVRPAFKIIAVDDLSPGMAGGTRLAARDQVLYFVQRAMNIADGTGLSHKLAFSRGHSNDGWNRA